MDGLECGSNGLVHAARGSRSASPRLLTGFCYVLELLGWPPAVLDVLQVGFLDSAILFASFRETDADMFLVLPPQSGRPQRL